MKPVFRQLSARELRRLAAKDRRRPPKPRRNEDAHHHMIVGSALVFGPLEAIIDQIEADGTLNCSPRGRPIFRDFKDGHWYDTAAALEGVIAHLEMYETRHGVTLPLDALRQFHRLVDHVMNIPQSLLDALRRDLPAIQRVIALSDPEDVLDLYRQTQIKFEMEALSP